MPRPVERLPGGRRVQQVLRRGRRAGGPAGSVHALPRDDHEPARAALVASRKVGGAVQRNRARRRLREALARAAPPAGHDYVVVARPDALDRPFDRLVADLARQGRRAAGVDGRHDDRREG